MPGVMWPGAGPNRTERFIAPRLSSGRWVIRAVTRDEYGNVLPGCEIEVRRIGVEDCVPPLSAVSDQYGLFEVEVPNNSGTYRVVAYDPVTGKAGASAPTLIAL